MYVIGCIKFLLTFFNLFSTINRIKTLVICDNMSDFVVYNDCHAYMPMNFSFSLEKGTFNQQHEKINKLCFTRS